MSEENAGQSGGAVKRALRAPVTTMRAFLASPRAIWGLNVPYLFEGIAYFGVLTLLMKYLSENLALGDIRAGIVVSFFTGGITLAMFFLGEMGDRYGLRRVLLVSIALMGVGRIFITVAGCARAAAFSRLRSCSARSLLIVAVSWDVPPALFSAVKRFSDPRTSAVAFAVIYGINNLVPHRRLLSPLVRQVSDDVPSQRHQRRVRAYTV
jgi:MFS family permease